MPPSWLNPLYSDEDIFSLSKIELDQMKVRVSHLLKCRWRNVCKEEPFALEVAGVEPMTEDRVKKAIEEYIAIRDNKPQKIAGESDSDFENRVSVWEGSLAGQSQLSMVINGCMVSWESPNGPWNAGHSSEFWKVRIWG